MKAWIGAALVAGALTFSGGLIATPATATELQISNAAGATTEFSARRRHHRVHRHYRQLQVYAPAYYARPYYYRPYRGLTPFFPFGFGYGLDPSW